MSAITFAGGPSGGVTLGERKKMAGLKKPKCDKQDEQLLDDVFMQPWFLPRELALAIRDILPPEHRHKMRYYFEDYGCLSCGKKNVPYGSNAMCRRCATGVKYKFFFAIKRRWDASPRISQGRPMQRDRMTEAQRLLRHLVS